MATEKEIQIDDIWYRYNSHSIQEEGMSEPTISIYLLKYRVTRITPAMVELDNRKRVLKEARKRYAYPTKELALNSFIKRTRWRVVHTERAEFVARKVLEYLNQIETNRNNLISLETEITIYKEYFS